MPHFNIGQAGIIAAITTVLSLVVGFGVIDNTQAGVIVSVATALVSAAFLVANSVHAFSHAKVKTSALHETAMHPGSAVAFQNQDPE